MPRQDDIVALGRSIFERLRGERPSIFRKDWWSGRMLDLTMRDPAFKVDLFRFVDVLPSLRSAAEVNRHVREYFERAGRDYGGVVRFGTAVAKVGGGLAGGLVASTIRKNVEAMARQFIAGRDAAGALPVLRDLRAEGFAFTVDLLGEACVSETEAAAYQRRYLDLIEALAEEARGWGDDPRLDAGPDGPLPRAHVSVKVSSLYSQIEPADRAGSIRVLRERLLPILRRARELRAGVTLDMEHYEIKDLTLDLFRAIALDPEFRGQPHLGIALQAYLKDTERDLDALLDWTRERPAPTHVRLVKGAYWDCEIVRALEQGWPIPVFTDKRETDACFERCARKLLGHTDRVRPEVGSHSVRSLAHAAATARELGAPDRTWEFQLLYGMAGPLARAVRELGVRTRLYVPVGEMLPGMAYLVRRLLENTANEGFLRRSFAEETDVDALLAEPASSLAAVASSPSFRDAEPCRPGGPFANEPPARLHRRDACETFEAALREVEARLGRTYPLRIDGRSVETGRTARSANPDDPEQIVAAVHQAGPDEARAALAAARRAFPDWMRTPPRERAEVLFRAAAIMRGRRIELAAWQVFEVGKAWREADADVVEAIDLCEYYGREMLRLGEPRATSGLPGETNHLVYEGCGPAVILAPWNFPLAILTGMSAAALVAGNPVVIKPSGLAPMMGVLLAAVLEEAGAPAGTVGLVPGPGSQIGDLLVDSPETSILAFTGSLEVGLRILERAARVQPGQREVKRVVCEMGGKNAIIVDSDADLDAAVTGVVASAFGFQGQKCSACSRVIVVGDAEGPFVERLVEAVRSLRIGPPRDPRNRVGPVIDAAAKRRIEGFIAKGEEQARVAIRREVPARGHYVGPTVFVDVEPDHVIAQEEIFGPVLAVLRARDFDEALGMALSTRYGLTGGVYSRSPAHIERSVREFRVGNLYLNRGCTGAVVGRQPFGGSRMSGVGSKAGGPDYLVRFLEARTVTENTTRRGFAPLE